MCGICGVTNFNKPIDPKGFEQQLDTLKHRGPDGAGTQFLENNTVALGHRRLSIIDLSKNGAQPMSNEDGTIWIAFNGEIYNFETLKKELISLGHHFKSKTDTEVIIHGYEEWGVNVLDKLNGMFAFGIYDNNKKQWFLARDRFGIKPLYYSLSDEKFVFASELKAIVTDKEFFREIDFDAVSDFFIYRFIPTPKSIWKGIKKLPPGHYCLLDHDSNLAIKAYWQLEPKNNTTTLEEVVEKSSHLLRSSIESRLLADVPIGLFLSGGYDSSLVAHFLHQLDYPLQSFCAGMNNWNGSEHEPAKIVADVFQSEHKTLMLKLENMNELMSKLSYYFDEPLGGSSFIPTYLISELAAQELKVVMAGDGGDEIFAGYNWHKVIYEKWNHNLLGKFIRWRKGDDQFLKNEYNKSLNWTKWKFNQLGQIFSKEVIQDELGKDDFCIYKKSINYQFGPIKAMQLFDYNLFLPEVILTKVDRASMANGLEVRVPFLDHRLAEFMISLNEKNYFQKGKNKLILFEILKKNIPIEILEKPKKGFGMPIGKLFSTNRMLDFVSKSTLANSGILSKNWHQNLNRNSRFNKIWSVYIFAHWYERWMS